MSSCSHVLVIRQLAGKALQNVVVALKPLGSDFAGADSFAQRAVGLLQVLAVAKTALSGQGPEFHKAVHQIFSVDVPKTEFTYAG